MKKATFGAGCFWCIEACYKDLIGVISVKPGYAGGLTLNPTYEEICTGTTGHAEVAYIEYDETLVSFSQLLEVFFFVHDPTSLNRQGADIGTQYRSVLFYHDADQKFLAQMYIEKLNDEGVWQNPIVTELAELKNFTVAEDYHHNYLALNPQNPYCQSVVRPKYEKFKKIFSEKLKIN